MGKIYRNQTALRFQLDCKTDISGSLDEKIRYEKPTGATGSWAASVLNATLGYIYYDVVATGDVDTVGVWTLWSFITFSDGRKAPGEPAEVRVYEEGT
jgi:hypothetical protein